MLSSCRFGRCHNESTRGLHEANRVRKTIDHEAGERAADIQWDISPLFNGGSNIQAEGLQPLKKTLLV